MTFSKINEIHKEGGQRRRKNLFFPHVFISSISTSSKDAAKIDYL